MLEGFLVDINGFTLSKEEEMLLQHPFVGGVLLFTRNYQDRAQLITLTQRIHALRPDLFIAVDHEGGLIQRFQRDGFRTLPPARLYGEVYDMNRITALTLATRYGYIMANDLISCGVDLSLAPILDLDAGNSVIGQLDRAFHREPAIVSILAHAFIKGMAEADMPCVGKHFPGHGSCLLDSHLTKPIDTQPITQLYERDMKPFIDLIQKNCLDGIMSAHVTYPCVDAEHPASFSKRWLTHILREELHFRGIVMSDCLSMQGAEVGDLRARTERAINAGCDIVIICHQTPDTLLRLFDTLKGHINESTKRIRQFKQKMLRFKVPQAII